MGSAWRVPCEVGGLVPTSTLPPSQEVRAKAPFLGSKTFIVGEVVGMVLTRQNVRPCIYHPDRNKNLSFLLGELC